LEAELKRKYSQAAHAKRSLKYAYIDGMTEDEQAEEMRDWHDINTPEYPPSAAEIQFDDDLIPF
jgi:disulfide oxidoreductase YuzD